MTCWGLFGRWFFLPPLYAFSTPGDVVLRLVVCRVVAAAVDCLVVENLEVRVLVVGGMVLQLWLRLPGLWEREVSGEQWLKRVRSGAGRHFDLP